MREDRVGEAVRAAVGDRVGLGGGAQERDRELASLRAVAVLGVVEERDAEVRLGEVRVAVRAALELRVLPLGVVVRRARDGAVLDLEAGLVRDDVRRERRAQELVRLAPVVGRGLEVEALGAGREADRLHEARGADREGRAQAAADGPVEGLGRLDLRRADGHAVEVFVDVPRVEGVRVVVVEREDVARIRARDELAPALLVERADHAERLRVDLVADARVLEDEKALRAAARRDGSLRRRGLQQRGEGARRDFHLHENLAVFFLRGQRALRAATRAFRAGPSGRQRNGAGKGGGRRVEERERVLLPREHRGGGLGGEGAGLLRDAADERAALLVDAVDRRAGDDVVELAEQERLPEAEQLGLRILRRAASGGRRAEHLCGAQRLLPAAVGELLRGLRGVGGAVHLEVELAAPDVEVGLLLGDAVHRVLREAERHGRAAVEGGAAAAALDVLLLRAAAAVAHAEERDGDVDDPRLAVVRLVVLELLGHQVRVVGVLRREVRDDARAVDALPHERVVRELVVAVPGELLREEEADAALAQDLRQLAGVAEDVGEPEVARDDAELLLEEALPDEALAHERLARGDVAVGLDPHAALHLPAAVGDGLLDLPVERRVVLLAELVELGLGRAVPELGVALHVEDLARERAADLADGLAQRPEPLHVDVRVADRGDAHRGGVDADAPHGPAQLLVDGARAAAPGRQQVERAARRADDLDAARGLLREGSSEGEDDVEVLLELPLVVVEAADRELVDGGAPRAVDRLRRGALRDGVGAARDAEHVVRAGVDPEVDLLAALRLREPVEVVLAVAGHERAAVREADERAALRVEDERLAVEVEVERDARALPRLRHLARHVEPAAVERAAPALAPLDRAVLELQALGVGDGLLRDGGLGAQRDALGGDFVDEAARDLADAVLVDVEVEVRHGLVVLWSCGLVVGRSGGPTV